MSEHKIILLNFTYTVNNGRLKDQQSKSSSDKLKQPFYNTTRVKLFNAKTPSMYMIEPL